MLQQLARIATLRREWDIAFLFRELLPVGPPLLEWLLVRKGMPVIYDFDDAIFLPNVSEANRQLGWLKQPQKVGAICRMSTHVTVGNRYLQAYALRYTSQVSVLPTTIDTDWYTRKEGVAIRGQPVLGWSGSLTTSQHLRTVLPTLHMLRQRYDFRLKVIGGEIGAVPGLEIECQPWREQTEVTDLQSFDIGMMPLPNDSWSRGKCGLKALQYMAVGVPTVASPIGVNSEIIQDGHNGFLATTEQEWVEKLSRLLSDESLRHALATEGRKTVEERYSAAVHVPHLLSILERVCQRAPDIRPHVSEPVSIWQTTEALR
jgi:glycosyltransferase involved in cell wall biosynthesis